MKYKTVSIHQPNFLPWLGYFDKIKKSDDFIILDNVQYAKGSVANRNKVLNSNGDPVYLTVPVKLSKGSAQTYLEISPSYEQKWQTKHKNLLNAYYKKAPFFEKYFLEYTDIIDVKYESLAQLNTRIIYWLIDLLEIDTVIHEASKLDVGDLYSNEQNISLVERVKGNVYLSGVGAKKYNRPELFHDRGIEIQYQDYSTIEYPQFNKSNFESNLSILDALFNLGPKLKDFI